MWHKNIGALALMLLCSVALAACEDRTGAATGRITLLLTDAPGDIHAAGVTVSQIYLQPGEGEGGARVILLDEAVTVSLLDLMNETTTLVEGKLIPAGTYAQLRVVISGGYIEVENETGGTTVYATPGYDQVPAELEVGGTLICPSCAQTGIKINYPGGIRVDNDETVILLDFDVARSFGRQAGASGNWVMHPVVDGIEFRTSGTITATLELGDGVTLPEVNGTQITLADFAARLTDDEDVDQGSVEFEEESGVWQARFRFLLPGSYVVTVEAPAGVTATIVPASADVTLTSGGSPTVAFTVTEIE
jgi:hypothetical protein